MADLGCLLVCTFGNFLAPVLVAAHTVNNLDLSHEQSFENEGYESDRTGRHQERAFLQNFVSRTEIQNFSKVYGTSNVWFQSVDLLDHIAMLVKG